MEMECLVGLLCVREGAGERERQRESARERMRARKPRGPEEGPLGKPKPQSWFELTSALLDTLARSFWNQFRHLQTQSSVFPSLLQDLTGHSDAVVLLRTGGCSRFGAPMITRTPLHLFFGNPGGAAELMSHKAREYLCSGVLKRQPTSRWVTSSWLLFQESSWFCTLTKINHFCQFQDIFKHKIFVRDHKQDAHAISA